MGNSQPSVESNILGTQVIPTRCVGENGSRKGLGSRGAEGDQTLVTSIAYLSNSTAVRSLPGECLAPALLGRLVPIPG